MTAITSTQNTVSVVQTPIKFTEKIWYKVALLVATVAAFVLTTLSLVLKAPFLAAIATAAILSATTFGLINLFSVQKGQPIPQAAPAHDIPVLPTLSVEEQEALAFQKRRFLAQVTKIDSALRRLEREDFPSEELLRTVLDELEAAKSDFNEDPYKEILRTSSACRRLTDLIQAFQFGDIEQGEAALLELNSQLPLRGIDLQRQFDIYKEAREAFKPYLKECLEKIAHRFDVRLGNADFNQESLYDKVRWFQDDIEDSLSVESTNYLRLVKNTPFVNHISKIIKQLLRGDACARDVLVQESKLSGEALEQFNRGFSVLAQGTEVIKQEWQGHFSDKVARAKVISSDRPMEEQIRWIKAAGGWISPDDQVSEALEAFERSSNSLKCQILLERIIMGEQAALTKLCEKLSITDPGLIAGLNRQLELYVFQLAQLKARLVEALKRRIAAADLVVQASQPSPNLDALAAIYKEEMISETERDSYHSLQILEVKELIGFYNKILLSDIEGLKKYLTDDEYQKLKTHQGLFAQQIKEFEKSLIAKMKQTIADAQDIFQSNLPDPAAALQRLYQKEIDIPFNIERLPRNFDFPRKFSDIFSPWRFEWIHCELSAQERGHLQEHCRFLRAI